MPDVNPRQQRILDELKSGALYSGKLLERVKDGPYSMGKDTLYKELKELERMELIRQFNDESRSPPRVYYEIKEKESDYRSGSRPKQADATSSEKATASMPNSNVNIVAPDISPTISPEVNVYVNTGQRENSPLAPSISQQDTIPEFYADKFEIALVNYLRRKHSDFVSDKHILHISSFKRRENIWEVTGHITWTTAETMAAREQRFQKVNTPWHQLKRRFDRVQAEKDFLDAMDDNSNQYAFIATFEPRTNTVTWYNAMYESYYNWRKDEVEKGNK